MAGRPDRKTSGTQVNKRHIPRIIEWARARRQPVTFFDLETTGPVPYVKWLGVTELALITVSPAGRIESTSALVNPERRIPKEAVELTGIRKEDVCGQPTWARWAHHLHDLAREHVMVGYGSSGFDCIVVIGQNGRYGVPDTAFAHSLDARKLLGVNGTLREAAASHGIEARNNHRALADAWTTARLVNCVADRHGLAELDQRISCFAGGSGSPRKERERLLAESYAATGNLPDLSAFATAHGIKQVTAETDVLRLVESGMLPADVLAVAPVQTWLSNRLPRAIEECWRDSQEQRLKPLMELLYADQPPVGLDYTQLRIALARWFRLADRSSRARGGAPAATSQLIHAARR